MGVYVGVMGSGFYTLLNVSIAPFAYMALLRFTLSCSLIVICWKLEKRKKLAGGQPISFQDCCSMCDSLGLLQHTGTFINLVLMKVFHRWVQQETLRTPFRLLSASLPSLTSVGRLPAIFLVCCALPRASQIPAWEI